MMRHKTGIVCVVSALAFAACSWGGQSGNSSSTPDAAGAPVCGDNVCAASEVGYCSQDCGSGGNNNNNQNAVCGNGQCETTKGESATSCPSDCGGNTGSNTGSGGGALDCADPNTTIGCGLCSVAMVCTPPYDAVSCAACGGGLGSGLGSGLGTGCVGGAPDGMCETGEDSTNCPFDCP